MPAFARSSPHPERQKWLELAADRRASGARPAELKDESGESFGYYAFLVPELDYKVITAAMPELNSKDKEEMARAWRRFGMTELGRRYALDASIGKRTQRRGVIVK